MRVLKDEFKIMSCSLSIVIVSFNSIKFLNNCLVSIFANTNGLALDVIVVDNNSSDGTEKKISEKYQNITLIKKHKNLGFAKACNQGLKVATGDYLLFLNPDTVIKKDTLVRSIKFLHSNPGIGLIGCKLLNIDGTLQPSSSDFPYLHKLIIDHALGWRIFPHSLRGKLLTKYWAHDKIKEVDWVMGAFMLMRRSLINQLGGFDEAFFLYGEDLELCFRVNKAGFKVVFFPNAEIIHIGNPGWDAERLEHVYDALLKFYSKHFSFLKTFSLKRVIKLAMLLRKGNFLGRRLKNADERYKSYI